MELPFFHQTLHVRYTEQKVAGLAVQALMATASGALALETTGAMMILGS